MGNPNERYPFDIAQGVAAWRLNDFGTQSGMQLLFNFEDMKGVNVAAVHGEFKPFDALDLMIAGTDIHYEFVNRRTVTLTRMGPAAVKEKVEPAKRTKDDRRSAGSPLEEVTVRGTQPSSLYEIGSRIRSVSRADIDASGFVTTQGIIRTLPQVFGGGPSEDTFIDMEARTNLGRGTGINLRGLGAGSTLVLMNGRRLPGAGTEGQFVDVSNLPLAAIERIDILPDSSSTLYGSDGVGGVANFVMRDRFTGRQTEAYFGDTTRSEHLSEQYISQLVGSNTRFGHGVFAFDYYSRDNLPVASREMAKSDLTEYGGSNFDTQQSNPGNITLGTTTWAIPKGQDGTHLQPSDFTPGSPPNLQGRNLGADILPVQKRVTGFGTWRYEPSDRLTIFGDLLVGQRDIKTASAAVSSPLAVPVTNAFYAAPVALPTPVPLLVSYSFYDDLGPFTVDAQITSVDFTGGFERRIGTWSITTTLSYATEHSRTTAENGVNAAALATALASSDRNTAFNPFGDGSHTNPATIESIRGYSDAVYDSRVASASLSSTGRLLAMPGGDLELTVGGESRRQWLDSTLRTNSTLLPTDTRSARDRDIYATFAELRVPLVGPANHLPGVESLSLSLAERYEHYSDFGGTSNPRFGVSWAPFRGVTLQGSYSASFRPPGLLELDESNNSWGIGPLPDPQTGQPANVLIWSGKNRELREETAHSWTAGIELEPERHPELALALTYFDTDFNDRLDRPLASMQMLSDPRYAAMVTRNPSPEYRAEVCSRAPRSASFSSDCLTTPIAAIVDLRSRNDATVETRGFDMLARYEKATKNLGRFSFSLNGTYITSFAEAKAANAPLLELVSTQNYPTNLKMRGTTRWQYAGFDIGAYVNFLNDYKDTSSNPERHVASWTTLDLRAAYTFSSASGGWLGDTTFALGAENLLDKDPPFLNNGLVGMGYDQENGDLTGRTVNFTVRKKW